MRSFDVAERRARLARRHRLAPSDRAASVEGAARSLVCLHATDPATVYLSARSRVTAMTTADMDRTLYDDRTLVKHLAMRRTLFAFPREVLDAVQGGASAKVAAAERRRLVRAVEQSGLRSDGEAWFDAAREAVLAALAGGREATSTELRAEIPLLEGSLTYGEGRSWGGQVPVGPRVLTVLSAAGELVRASNAGGWTTSRPRWATMESWLGRPLDPPDVATGTAQLVRAWLAAFGPGTDQDLKWWLGGTLTGTRRALAAVGAVEVDLGAGRVGHVLPDDLGPTERPGPWVALLPALDPTTMGWFERDWYLSGHRTAVFDGNGNGGSTAWSDGRIVGGWHQSETGEVVVGLLEPVDPAVERALTEEAGRLTDWLAGVRVAERFPSPLTRRAGAKGPATEA